MPELPEVEITRRAIAPFLEGKSVCRVTCHHNALRLPLPAELRGKLPGMVILRVERRAKYLLLRATSGSVILHLGMSGSLEVVPATEPQGKHDHLYIVLGSGLALRFNDPRRFGLALWTDGDPLGHPLLKGLGPEPLEEGFDGDYLLRRSRGRKATVKQFIMNGHVVAGIGNIYANEALFRAGIHPATRAGEIPSVRYRRLAAAIGEVLRGAIAQGDRALENRGEDGIIPTRFPLTLAVYGRGGEPCNRCGTLIQKSLIGGRSTYHCGKCQKCEKKQMKNGRGLPGRFCLTVVN